jgi:DNA helicase-4
VAAVPALVGDIEEARLAHNQAFTESMLEQYRGFFASVESSPLNPAQARAVVNGERALLVLAGAGSGKTSVLVARAGWLLTRGEAAAEQILLLAFGRQAAQEMDERIRERLGSEEIPRVPFTRWRCILFSRAAKKCRPSASWRATARPARRLLLKSWRSSARRKKRRRKAGGCGWKKRWAGRCRKAILAG